MKYPTVLISLFLPGFAQAAQSPFQWPDSYSITCAQTFMKDGYGDPFTNIYSVDHQRARNEVRTAKNDTATIFQLDTGKMIDVASYGVHQSAVPPGTTLKNPFPTNGDWQVQGQETLNGLSTTKYKVVDDPADPDSVYYVWLTADGKTPVQMMDGKGIGKMQFSAYSPGPQDPRLFEAPAK